MDPYGEENGNTEVKENKMRLEKIINELELEVYTGDKIPSGEANGAYVCDLLSDVMGHAKERDLWITLQSHLNVVAIATLKELAAVLLVKGIEPEGPVLEKAMEEGVVILGSHEDTFTLAGKLFQLLNRG